MPKPSNDYCRTYNPKYQREHNYLLLKKARCISFKNPLKLDRLSLERTSYLPISSSNILFIALFSQSTKSYPKSTSRTKRVITSLT